VTWADAPTVDDVADAAWFLTLLDVHAAAMVVAPDQRFYPAKDLLRASRLPVLPRDNRGSASGRDGSGTTRSRRCCYWQAACSTGR